MGKVTAFHDALCYLASLTEVKSTLRLRLHVFFVVVISTHLTEDVNLLFFQRHIAIENLNQFRKISNISSNYILYSNRCKDMLKRETFRRKGFEISVFRGNELFVVKILHKPFLLAWRSENF